MNPSDDDLSFAGETLDPFAPLRADDTIAAALRDRDAAAGSPEGRLVLALAAGHALPAGADAALERVRSRLTAAPLTLDAPVNDAGDSTRARPPARQHVPRPITRTQNALRALAAVLLVALLAGGFVLALHGRQGAVTHAPHWVDVSITRAHTTRPLNFDLANGISYAVAETGGIIYACSGTSLWYSDDGGATYAPFTPAPPTGTMDGKCTLSTVPGLPGVFVYDRVPSNDQIRYATPRGTWRTLALPGLVPSSVPISPASLLLSTGAARQAVVESLFPIPATYDAPTRDQPRAAGGWLFLLVQIPQPVPGAGPASAVIGTPDFGQRWVWVDASLFAATQHDCTAFAVSRSIPTLLACSVGDERGYVDPSRIAISVDLGQIWREVPSPSGAIFPLLVGASDAAVYYAQVYADGKQDLIRYDISGGRTTVADDLARHAPYASPALTVTAQDTLYEAFPRVESGGVAVTLVVLRPGASGEEQSLFTATTHLSALQVEPIGIYGDLDGAAPALYLGAGDAPGISSLYRLALPVFSAPAPALTATVTVPIVPPQDATPHPPARCASDPVTTAAIQPGGLGALNSTFAARWGGDAEVALGTTYFGRYQDTGMPIVGVPSTALGAGARVPNLTYHVDSTAHVTLAQAQAIAATILPADVHAIPTGAPPSPVSPITYAYCSAAFWAAFPPSTPSFTYGELAVTYTLRSDGSVDSIDFAPAIIG